MKSLVIESVPVHLALAVLSKQSKYLLVWFACKTWGRELQGRTAACLLKGSFCEVTQLETIGTAHSVA